MVKKSCPDLNFLRHYYIILHKQMSFNQIPHKVPDRPIEDTLKTNVCVRTEMVHLRTFPALH